jgi:hypothetical protein
MPQLKAEREDESHHQFDKRLAVVQQLNVGRFIVEIDGDGTIVPRPFGCLPMCYLPIIRSQKLVRHDGGNTLNSQDYREGFRTLPRNPMECVFSLDNSP